MIKLKKLLRKNNSNGFFTLATDLDIIGLIFAIVVFICGFYRLSNIRGGVRSVELFGIIFAGTAIFLMWYNFNNGKKGSNDLRHHKFQPT